MKVSYSLREVRELVRGPSRATSPGAEAVDRVIGLTVMISAASLGPGGTELLALLGARDEVAKLCRSALEGLASRTDSRYMDQHERIQAAFVTMGYAAFFEALDATLPPDLRKAIRLRTQERAWIAKQGAGSAAARGDASGASAMPGADRAETRQIEFPHPLETLDVHLSELKVVWREMSDSFVALVKHLALWDELPAESKHELDHLSSVLPRRARQHFEAMYLDLAARYAPFAIWSNLRETRATSLATADRLSEQFSELRQAERRSRESVDLGLRSITELLAALPVAIAEHRSRAVSSLLRLHAQAKLRDPILDFRGGGAGSDRLPNVPSVQDGFVPQSFCALRFPVGVALDGLSSALDARPRRDDLSVFFTTVLSSPYAVSAPILVLGQPGSGKSMLTRVLAGRLSSEALTVVHVRLRDVDPEAGIHSLIDEAIRSSVGASDGWEKLSLENQEWPPVVILDGYDELLQANGRVFRGFLNEVKRFQLNEFALGRPVRFVVTSRESLIDKVTVPDNTTIVRLNAFDEVRIDAWIAAWNDSNRAYFAERGLKPFQLPEVRAEAAGDVHELAKQPLLLSMLAAFDANDNALEHVGAMDRGGIYRTLLRAFVLRELSKATSFVEFDDKERGRALDAEMTRLSIAALAMLNRRGLSISLTELDRDLDFFNVSTSVPSPQVGRPLTQAELLAGRFWFVNESVDPGHAHDGTGAISSRTIEFLHATFGEYLVADVLVRQARRAVQSRDPHHHAHGSRDEDPGDGGPLGPLWSAGMAYTSLLSRPNLVSFFADCARHDFAGPESTSLLETLDRLLNREFLRVLDESDGTWPLASTGPNPGYPPPWGNPCVVGQIAVYTLNLVVFRVGAFRTPFVLREATQGGSHDGPRLWKRLVNVWRAWFSLEDLLGVTALVETRLLDAAVLIQRPSGSVTQSERPGRLRASFDLAAAISDDGAVALGWLALGGSPHGSTLDLESALAAIKRAGLSSDPPEGVVAVTELHTWLRRARASGDDIERLPRLARRAFDTALDEGSPELLMRAVIGIREAAGLVVREAYGVTETPARIFMAEVASPESAWRASLLEPSAGFLLYELARAHDLRAWMKEFGTWVSGDPPFLRGDTNDLSRVSSMKHNEEYHLERLAAASELARLLALAPELEEAARALQLRVSRAFLERPDWTPAEVFARQPARFAVGAFEVFERLTRKSPLGVSELRAIAQQSPATVLAWFELALDQAPADAAGEPGARPTYDLRRLRSRTVFLAVFPSDELIDLTARDPAFGESWVKIYAQMQDEKRESKPLRSKPCDFDRGTG